MNNNSSNADLNNSLPETYGQVGFYTDKWAEENDMLSMVELSPDRIVWFQSMEADHWDYVQDEIDEEYMQIYGYSEWAAEYNSEDEYDQLDSELPSPEHVPTPSPPDSIESLGDAESDGMPDIITLDNNVWGHGEEEPTLLSDWAPRFVASLERVELSAVPSDQIICPICWIELGETYEFHDLYEPPDLPSDPREAGNMIAFQQLPFDLSRPNNDPVKLPCEHLFGYDCLVNSLSENSTCPMCRRELR